MSQVYQKLDVSRFKAFDSKVTSVTSTLSRQVVTVWELDQIWTNPVTVWTKDFNKRVSRYTWDSLRPACRETTIELETVGCRARILGGPRKKERSDSEVKCM